MNIFYVHSDPEESARSLCDQHIVKMPLETAQVLCTVARGLGIPSAYKATHKGHPSVLWAGFSRAQALWLWQHGMALSREYTRRYGRVHKSQAVLESLKDLPSALPDLPWCPPPQVMPEEFRQEDTVQAYRDYYRSKDFARWRHSIKPDWT